LEQHKENEMVNMEFIGMAAALALSATGSGMGAGVASMAAVGGWKKCYVENKPAPFIMIAFAGAPLTQTIYGFLLMNFIASAIAAGVSATLSLSVGVLGGFAIGLSAYMQGRASAAACDALAETGKGTANYFIVIGIVETVALFTLVLSLLALQ
jgi:V/A-type H+-transporting ATPase subunit K